MRTWFRASLPLAAAFALAACGDTTEPSSATPTLPEVGFARVPSECSTSSLASLSRSYFSNPERREAADTLRAMEAHCAEGAAGTAAAVNGGWHLLGMMESVLESGTGGAAADGAALANGLVAYMCVQQPALCAQSPAAVTAADLGPEGIFAVRAGGTDPILARGKVSFTDFDGNGNAALWGLATTSNWASATTAATVLVYGAPAQAGTVTLDEQSIGGLAYDLHTFPDVPRFQDGELHVAACYDADIVLPHPDGDESQPVLWERMQREGTVLQPFVPPCAAWTALLETPTVAAHLGQGLRRLAAWAFQPQPLFAAFFGDRRAASVGGTPIDFSTFAPVAANRSGSLVFVEPLADAFQNATAGVPLGPIVVQALSGEGTPMELVEVELYVAGNQGEPAGATFCDPAATDPSQCVNPTEFTQEAASGYGTAATFTGATLYKAGGFRICARATPDFRGGEAFTFTEACSGVFTLKNN